METILVNQFRSGKQGRLDNLPSIKRRVRCSTASYPVFNSCCCSMVIPRSFHWVRYRGRRWQVKRDNLSGGAWVLTLPSQDVLVNEEHLLEEDGL